jgi:hypothetical protein
MSVFGNKADIADQGRLLAICRLVIDYYPVSTLLP